MKIVCPNGCKPEYDTPFYYPGRACGLPDDYPEMGVLAYDDAQPSERWEDGTVGIPEHILEFIIKSDDWPLCCECHDEAVPIPAGR